MKILFLLVTAFLLMSAFGECMAKRRSGSPIRIGFDSEPRTIDPRYAMDANSQYVEALLNCSLITFGPEGNVEGDLAEEWKWLGNNQISFKLKKGYKFSDGRPVTARDVASTYEFFLRKDVKKPSPRAGAFRNIESIRPSKSNDAIIFILKEPDASYLTNFVVGILPQDLATKPLMRKPKDHKGCGPFKLTQKGLTTWTLVKNPQFGGKNAPKINQLELKIVKSESTRFAKLRKGEIDLVQNTLNREVLPEVGKKYANLKMMKRPGLRTSYLGFNMKDKLAGNLEVRKAISLAINRDQIIKYIFGGMATPAKTILTPGNPYELTSLEKPSFNVEQAKKILDKAGFKDPDGDGPKSRFEISYKTTTDATRINIAKAIASQLRKVGISVKVQPLEWGKFKEDVEKGRVQVWSLTWIGFKDPDIYRYAFGTDNAPPNGPNRGWYSNKKLDAFLNKAVKTTDQNERIKLYHEVQKIVAAELPYVFLWHEEAFAVMNKDIEGFEIYADGRLTSLTKVVAK